MAFGFYSLDLVGVVFVKLVGKCQRPFFVFQTKLDQFTTKPNEIQTKSQDLTPLHGSKSVRLPQKEAISNFRQITIHHFVFYELQTMY